MAQIQLRLVWHSSASQSITTSQKEPLLNLVGSKLWGSVFDCRRCSALCKFCRVEEEHSGKWIASGCNVESESLFWLQSSSDLSLLPKNKAIKTYSDCGKQALTNFQKPSESFKRHRDRSILCQKVLRIYLKASQRKQSSLQRIKTLQQNDETIDNPPFGCFPLVHSICSSPIRPKQESQFQRQKGSQIIECRTNHQNFRWFPVWRILRLQRFKVQV